MKSTAENLQLWEQRIRERVQNGMTIGEWCEKNGVSKNQYNYWNQRVRKSQKTGEETTFADITVCASVKGPKADGIACPEIDRYNDHIIVKEKDVSLKHDPALTGL